jgi:plastocyanin
MKKIRLLVCSFVLVAVAAGPASAVVAASAPGGFAAGYATPVVVLPKGEPLTFYNGDVPQHDFVALEAFLSKKAAKKSKWCSGYRKGKCPLFWSPKIGVGQSTEVLGLERTKSGKQYAFYCTLHPNMKGTLVVQ